MDLNLKFSYRAGQLRQDGVSISWKQTRQDWQGRLGPKIHVLEEKFTQWYTWVKYKLCVVVARLEWYIECAPSEFLNCERQCWLVVWVGFHCELKTPCCSVNWCAKLASNQVDSKCRRETRRRKTLTCWRSWKLLINEDCAWPAHI